jgi:hypothetical protein
LAITDGARPVSWSLEEGPNGAQIDSQTGQISGWFAAETDVSTNPHHFVVKATNSAASATAAWDVVVAVMNFGTRVAKWTFDSDADGWIGQAWAAGPYSPGQGNWVSTGGNPGGFLHANGDGGTNSGDACTREGWSWIMPYSTVGMVDITISYDVLSQLLDDSVLDQGCYGGSACMANLLEGSCEDKVLLQYSTTGTAGPWTTVSGLREGTDLPTYWSKYYASISGAGVEGNANFAFRFIWQFNTGADNGDIDNVILWSACNIPPEDVDGDGDVDQADFAVLQACFTGPDWSGPLSQACHCLDQGDDNGDGLPDHDGNIDNYDILAFEKCASGPGIPADPGCASGM